MRLRLTILFSFFVVFAHAQSDKYNRPTVNFMLLNHKDGLAADVEKVFGGIPNADKFFYNEIATKRIPLASPRNGMRNNESWREVADMLGKEKVAQQLISYWYSRTSDGKMSMERIHQRGEYNASDEDLIISLASKRGAEALKETGRSLVRSTYVVLLDYTNIEYHEKRVSSSSSDVVRTWRSQVFAYVFELNYSEETEGLIYDAWIDDEDTPEAIAQKNKAFEDAQFSLRYVKQYSGNIVVGGESINPVQVLRFAGRGKNELFTMMVQDGYAFAMNKLESDNGKQMSFAVRAPVFGVDPISAKIGKKESLRTDQRYYVLEMGANEKKEVVEHRVGVVRVGRKVVDNRKVVDGQSQESEFYQIAGGSVEKGMTLKQKNDAGGGLTLGVAVTENIGGIARYEQLLNKLLFTSSPGIYLYLEGTMEFGKDKFLPIGEDKFTNATAENYTKYTAGVGFGKNYHPLRNLQISPYIGGGILATLITEKSTGEAVDYTIYDWHLGAGAQVAVNIYYPIQVIAGASGYFLTGAEVQDKDSKVVDAYANKTYGDLFDKQNSFGYRFYAGLRFNF